MTIDSPGFYGKVPSHGDFVTRRLTAEFTAPWDQWLQGSLAASRAELGEGWLEHYLTSPLWRFVLSPGIAGQRVWAGVLMPSVDRVGRYFPLTLACPLPAGINAPAVLAASDWFAAAESLALTALTDPFSLETFDGQVQALGIPPASVLPTTAPTDGRARPNAWHLGGSAALRPADACALLLDQALGFCFLAYSLWWTQGSDQVGPSVLSCQGLPPADGFGALLDGDWGGRGWRALTAAAPGHAPEN